MISFGLRIPDFPLNGHHGNDFRDQIISTLDTLDGCFVSAWVADHFIPWANFQDPFTDTFECWTTLSYLAGIFHNYTFGSIVLSQSYRSPALLAKMASTLQILTNGRFVLGLGAGWKQDEYLAYGYDYPNSAARIEQLSETVQIIRAMWDQPRATFIGKYYRIEDAICEPKPSPRIPVLIGGGGKKLTLRVVAQYADWWNYAGGTSNNYSELLSILQDHCNQIGRDYESIVKTWLCECVAIAGSSEEAQSIAHASPLFQPNESIVGTPDEVINQLRSFTDLGVQHFILRFADFPSTKGANLFAKKVIPYFTK